MVAALESLEEEIATGDHSSRTSSLLLSHATIYFSAFQVMKFGNFVELSFHFGHFL